MKSVDACRLKLIEDTFAPQDLSKPLDKIKGFDPSTFPPCKSVLSEKFNRLTMLPVLSKEHHIEIHSHGI